LLEKVGIDLETAKAAARRAQIREEIVKEDGRRVLRQRVLRKHAPTAAVAAAAAAEQKPDQPGRKRKARSEP
jgi:4'-phosphopantetheinyl transferase EntD